MKQFVFAVVLLFGSALNSLDASAADMAFKSPPALVPAESWTGFYIGGNLGGAFGHDRWDSANNFGQPGCGVIPCGIFGATGPVGASYDFNGFLGGVQAGANYQIKSLVLGVEGDFDWLDKDGFAGACNPPLPQPPFRGPGASTRCQSTTHWLASVTARVGYSWGKVLPYVKGGVAWADDVYQFGRGEPQALALFPMFQTETTRVGWTVGVGVEYAFLPNWSTFAEYNYYDFGAEQLNLAPTANIAVTFPEPMNIGEHFQTIKVGLNYRFH